MDTPEARLRNKLQIAVSSMEVAAGRVEKIADRTGTDRAVALELRDIGVWLRRAVAAATRP